MQDKAINPEDFVEELEAMRQKTLDQLRSGRHGRLSFGDSAQAPHERPQVVAMLRMLMYPERRVADVLASRLAAIEELEIQEGVANQIFEEIHHAQLLRRMLAEWGHDPDEPWTDPIRELVEIFDYIQSLDSLSEFFSTFLIGEGLFLGTYLEDMALTDPDAFAPYLPAALADEPGHIALAKAALMRYATTAELQSKTRRSAERLLEMFLGGYRARLEQMEAELSAGFDA